MRHLFIIIVALLAFSGNVRAQKKKDTTAKPTTTRPAAAESKPVTLTQEEINFRDMLPSTAKITFVDSMVVSKSVLNDSLFLSKSTGSIVVEGSDSTAVYTYTNDLDNFRIISMVDETGYHRLYSSSKVGTEWSEKVLLDMPGDHRDIICPYMMNDGTTLYFSALDGENNVGKHDIFMTIYDSDDEKFMTPQSIGLPFNSPSEDFYYIIDETYNLGYLVTGRRQETDKVCIYAFLPTETREIYENADESSLHRYANIHSIATTQRDKESVAEAQKAILKVRNTISKTPENINFQLTKDITYHSITDFKSSKARMKFNEYYRRMTSLKKDEEHLVELRRNYKKGQTYTASEIENLETTLESERIAVRRLENDARTLELSR